MEKSMKKRRKRQNTIKRIMLFYLFFLGIYLFTRIAVSIPDKNTLYNVTLKSKINGKVVNYNGYTVMYKDHPTGKILALRINGNGPTTHFSVDDYEITMVKTPKEEKTNKR